MRSPAIHRRFLLDDVVSDAECTEITADEILDYIPHGQHLAVIQHWVSKLRHGGRIKVGGTDLYEVAKVVMNQLVTNQEANLLLHGNHQHAWDIKHGQMTLNQVVSILRDLGLHIEKQRLNGTKMLVEANRK